MSSRTKNSGFTLIELIVIILLVSIVSVYAASRYTGSRSITAQLLESELLSSLRLTQLRAMHRNGLCGRWLVAENQAAHVSPSASEGACVTSISNNDRKDSSFVDAAAKGGNLSIVTNSGQHYLDFDSLGRVTQCTASDCKVSVQTTSGEVRSICINYQGGIDGC